MSTLKELVDEHGEGVTFINRGSSTKKDVLFTPYFLDRFGDYHGLCPRNNCMSRDATTHKWQLYVEPKVMIRKYLWYCFREEKIKIKYPAMDTDHARAIMCESGPVFLEVEE